jgi:uncharacterized iron-regulated protein
MKNITEKEKEMFLAWSKLFDKEKYQKRVDHYFREKKEIENSLKK